MRPAITWPLAVASVLLFFGCVTAAFAAQPILLVGDDAPRLETGDYLRGGWLTNWEKGKTYLIEFWNTGCEPCRLALGSLNTLQRKYQDRGLIILAQNCWEEHFETINVYLDSVSKHIEFRVALDKSSRTNRGSMAGWMAAARRGTLPVAFIINNEGKVAWIDSPVYLNEKELEQILDGTYDLASARVKYARDRTKEQPFQAAIVDLNKKIGAKDWAGATAALSRARQVAIEGEQDTLDLAQYQMLLGQKDGEGAYQFAVHMGEKYKDNALMQNELAWQIANEPSASSKSLSLADTFATRANVIAREKNPGILDTLARVRFVRGDQAGAISAEKKAIEAASGVMKTRLEQILASYQRGELPGKKAK